jgi:REP element-mobilizing transposase RayT
VARLLLIRPGVTAPRQIIPNTTYLVTRRCSERRMFLRPSDAINELVLYILAVSVERFGILLHAYCFMSNHVHLVLTDPRGVLPAFEQYLGSLIARACNALVGHRESFWDPGSYNAVTLVQPGDVEDKIAYALANPISAGLVQEGAQWPGLCSSLEGIGGPAVVVRRPEHFFRKDGSMPASASLALAVPPNVESLPATREAIRRELVKLQTEAIEKLASEGRTFLGAQRVLTQDRFAAPAGEEPRRRIEPRIACRDRGRRMEALARLKAFLAAYRETWQEFVGGVRDAVFPHGTYWMRVAYGLPCAPAG